MTASDAQQHFRAGLRLLTHRHYAQAAEHFEAAMQIDRKSRALRPQMRYRSYLGLSRSLAKRPTHEDVQLCEQAAEADNFDPVMQLNLAKVYTRAGRVTHAIAAIQRGLRLDPKHEALNQLLTQVDRRTPPVLPRLGRDHAINRSIGRLRTLTLFRNSRAS